MQKDRGRCCNGNMEASGCRKTGEDVVMGTWKRVDAERQGKML